MAYSKLYKLVQDSQFSYQFANQLADNQQEMHDLQLVEHGDVEYLPGILSKGAPAVDYHKLGRHDLEEVPRSIGFAALYLQSFTSVGIQWNLNGPGIPFVIKDDVGSYIIPVVGLRTWWAKVSQLAGSGLTYLEPQVRPFYPSVTNFMNQGIRIYTYALDSGDFVPTDMSFSIALYGTTP